MGFRFSTLQRPYRLTSSYKRRQGVRGSTQEFLSPSVDLASLLLPATELALLMRYTGLAALGECNTAAQGEQRRACQRDRTGREQQYLTRADANRRPSLLQVLPSP